MRTSNQIIQILQVINTTSNSDGGPSRNSLELNMSLNRLDDFEAQLLSIHGVAQDSVLRDIDTRSVPANWPQPIFVAAMRNPLLGMLRSLSLSIRKSDCVIIHGYYLNWVPLVALLCIFSGTPYLITPHGALTAHQRRVSVMKKRLFEMMAGGWVRHRAAGFVTGSEAERTEVLQHSPRSRVSVGGVGTGHFEESSKIIFLGRHEPIRLLSMSRVAPKKRIELSIQACSLLAARGIEFEFVIAGSGDETLLEHLTDLVNSLELNSQVSFIGEVFGSAKDQLLRESDIFLFPSDDENFGIALAEALARGLPSVTSSAVAAAHGLHEPAGIVLESPTRESIANAIEDLMQSEHFERNRSAAFHFAAENFDWNNVAQQWRMAILGVSRSDSDTVK